MPTSEDADIWFEGRPTPSHFNTSVYGKFQALLQLPSNCRHILAEARGGCLEFFVQRWPKGLDSFTELQPGRGWWQAGVGCGAGAYFWLVPPHPGAAFLRPGPPAPEPEESWGCGLLLQGDGRPANRPSLGTPWGKFHSIQCKNIDCRPAGCHIGEQGSGKLHLSVLAFLQAVGGASISGVGGEMPNALLFCLVHLTDRKSVV